MNQKATLFAAAVFATAIAYPIVGTASAKTADPNDTALIVRAKAAFEKGQAAELDRIAAKSKGHLLAAWPDYWALRMRISDPRLNPQEVHSRVSQFITKHAGHPLTERVQQDFVEALAKKELWEDAFIALQDLPSSTSTPQINCVRAKAELLRNAQNPQAAALIPIGQEAFLACGALVAYLADQKIVDSAYLKQRLRWAAQTGNASARSQLFEIFQANTKPFEREARGPNPVSSERNLVEVLQQARSNSMQALQTLERHRKNLNHEQAHYAAFAVGAALWQRTHPRAWPLMREGWESLSQQPGQVLQMAAREAIRRHEWAALIEIISAMQPSLQQESTWVYWRAVALSETQNNKDQAVALFQSLRQDFGFYGVLAREILKEPLRIPQASTPSTDARSLRALDEHLGMKRSYALVRAGLRAEAVQEWSAAMRGKTDAQLLLAARHAKEQGLTDRMIAAADRTREDHDFELRYPAAFKDNVLPAARAESLDPWWVLGLIRQESRFIPDIRSSAGATGLMQIMPATGKMVAKDVGIKTTRGLSLENVEINIQLGTRYLRQLQDRFDGSALLASAAYNAGPARAARWRSALPKPIDGAAFAESIPFSETRDYVKRVLTNAVLYHAVHNGGEAPSLKKLLGEIIPGQSS